jgi:apolipoprotein N-acyltransferase
MSSSPQSPFPWKRSIVRAWPWLAAAASGVMLVLCFPPWNQAWLCWLALTPLIAAVWFGQGGEMTAEPPGRLARIFRRLPPWARAFALGYVTGLIFIWGAFYWLIEVTGIGWFVLAFYMGLYGALWAWFIGTVGNAENGMKNPASPATRTRVLALSPSLYLRSRWNLWFAFLGAAMWVALEWVRGLLFSGFGWNNLGVALHANIPFMQIAEWTGVGGLSFLVAFVNLIAVSTVYRFAMEVRLHRIRPHFDFTLTLSALLLVFAHGVRVLQVSSRADSPDNKNAIPLRVAAVQANIPQMQKFDPAFEAHIFQTYEHLTEAAMATRPDLLLWPEAATPQGYFADRTNFEFVNNLAKHANCNFLLGTLDYDFGDEGHVVNAYNAALLLPREGGDAEIYRKLHLVPFGEFIPFRHSFPLFAWIVGDQVPSDFSPGENPGVFQTVGPEVRLAPLICFEDTLGRVARQPVLLGAQVLVNVTNDGWFGHSAANEQQLNESVFRAVENRRPLLRCANTGVTAFIDRNGRISRVLRAENGSPFIQGVLAGEVRVPTDPALTFYTRHGEVFSAACAAGAGLAALLGGWRAFLRKRGRKTFSEVEQAPELAPVP